MIDIINPYVAKILITARDGDSIRAISKRIALSYAWTYKWVEKLVEIGIMKRKGQKIKVNTEDVTYQAFLGLIKTSLQHHLTLSDAYALPHLSGLTYAFTETDAVFIWTDGGYNIARSRDNYPIFIEVLDKDIEQWKRFFKNVVVGVTTNIEKRKGIYFVLMPKKEITNILKGDVYVIPLENTVAYAQKYIYNFQPALEMLDQMYNLNMNVEYAEKIKLKKFSKMLLNQKNLP